MKKLSFILGFSFLAIMTFAQNTANLTQAGGSQQAIIGQAGANTANVAQSTDDATKQKVTVNQDGTNTITINQIESGVATGSLSIPVQTADVIQKGTGNSGVISQSETGDGDKALSSATLNQNGNYNTSNQTTTAPAYNSGLTIIGLSNGDWNTIMQNITSGYTEYYKAEQIGTANHAYQTGSGSNADGTIYQNGTNNTGTQILEGQNNGYYRTGMLIKQIGGDNTSYQNYTGFDYGEGNSGEAYQYGSYNNATQTGYGHHYTSILTQDGSWNTAAIAQNGTANPLLVDNSVELYQWSNGNTSSIVQEKGSVNNIKLYQTGAGIANVTQTSDVADGGGNNKVEGLHTNWQGFDASWAKFTGSRLDVLQKGKENTLSLEADGVLGITQDGMANMIKLNKTGGGVGNIVQDGDNNKIAQFDDVLGLTPAITDHANFNGSTMAVTQNGSKNMLNLDSTSAYAIVNVMQAGDANKASVVQHP